VALASLFSLRVLSEVKWDATVFVGVGGEANATRQYTEERLGPVFLRGGQGHDGKYFFVQANDPWILEPRENIAVVDRPLYRSQRMLYPLLAGAGGAFSPGAIVWALLAINVVAMGVGTWATALIAQSMGVSPWWGLAFTLNLGFISELIIDGAGIVASAAAFGAVALMLRKRLGWGILLLVLAALTREAMLIAAVGSAWWLWRERDKTREAIMVVGMPIAVVVIWAVYVRWRVGWAAGVSEVREIGWPFFGFAQAVETWIGDPLDLAIGVVLLTLLLMFARGTLKSRDLVGWAFLGFVGLGLVFTKQVWESYFDITRAIAPVTTAFVLLVVVSKGEPRRTGVGAAP
jgi:hypothetical protein